MVTPRGAGYQRGPRSTFEFTFPQGVIWGLIGCIMSFAVGLVVERTHGTLVRLQIAPLTRAAVLAGKGLGCFLAASWRCRRPCSRLPRRVPACACTRGTALLLAMVSAAGCFVGIMMLVAASRAERTVHERGGMGDPDADVDDRRRHDSALRDAAVAGAPERDQPGQVGHPRVRRARPGAPSAYGEMLVPCGVLMGVGVVAFALGTRFVKTM